LDKLIDLAFQGLAESLTRARNEKDTLKLVAQALADTLIRGGTLFLCGNGGSAAEAQHFAAEFVGRFLQERPGLPAYALTADTSKLTAIGNDYGFD
jgi:D-sedoheptulose 7-phosphate isomerase